MSPKAQLLLGPGPKLSVMLSIKVIIELWLLFFLVLELGLTLPEPDPALLRGQGVQVQGHL